MTHNNKDNIKYLDETVFQTILKRENLNYGGLSVDKGSGSGIFPDPNPGDPKRPDPTGSATLVKTQYVFPKPLYLLNASGKILKKKGNNTNHPCIQ